MLAMEATSVFAAFDKDGDGKVSASELRCGLASTLGEDVSEEDAATILATVDADGDGLLNQEEFSRLAAGAHEDDDDVVKANSQRALPSTPSRASSIKQKKSSASQAIFLSHTRVTTTAKMAETLDQRTDDYHPQDALGHAVKATAISGGAGLFISTIQNTLTKQNAGAWGVFTRSGSTIGIFAAMGGAYMFTKDAAANLRKKDDSYNSAIGGAFAGSMLGLKFRSAPAVFGYGAALSVVLAAFTFTGGKLTGYERDPTVDEVSRKEYLRKNRRRPVDEIVNELGEGRGITAPGYEERRAQRIKANYGIDVPVAASS